MHCGAVSESREEHPASYLFISGLHSAVRHVRHDVTQKSMRHHHSKVTALITTGRRTRGQEPGGGLRARPLPAWGMVRRASSEAPGSNRSVARGRRITRPLRGAPLRLPPLVLKAECASCLLRSQVLNAVNRRTEFTACGFLCDFLYPPHNPHVPFVVLYNC